MGSLDPFPLPAVLRRPRQAGDLFACERLDCVLATKICIARQRLTVLRSPNILGSSRHKRGTAPEFVACYQCPQGQRLRQRFGDACAADVRHGARTLVQNLQAAHEL